MKYAPARELTSMAVVEGIRDLFLESETFKAAVAPADPLKRVKYYADEEDLSGVYLARPHLILIHSDMLIELTEAESCYTGRQNSVAVMYAADSCRQDQCDEPDMNWEYVKYCNERDGIILDLLNSGGEGGVYRIQTITQMEAPTRTPKKDRQDGYDFWKSAFLITTR